MPETLELHAGRTTQLHIEPAPRIGSKRSWVRNLLSSLARRFVYLGVLLDLLLVGTAAWLALSAHPLIFTKLTQQMIYLICAVAALTQSIVNLALNNYSLKALRSWRIALPAITGSALLATLISFLTGYFTFYHVPGRWIVIYLFAGILLALLASRLPFLLLRRLLTSRLLLIGSVKDLEAIEQLLTQTGPHAYSFAGFLDTGVKNKPDLAKLQALCRSSHVDLIVLAGSKNDIAQWFDLSIHTVRQGVKLSTLPEVIEQETQAVPVDLVDASDLIGRGWDLRNHTTEMLKRTIDIGVGLLGMALTLPILLLMAVLIKLTTRGPVLYSQLRVGRFGDPFRIWKIRTMRVDAERNGAVWAQTDDPRLTWYGKFLRKSRLDETPQFWNIFWGDMSLIGPRPERPEFVEELNEALPFYQCRHLVRPGLSGWAQINYRYGASQEDARRKLEFDLYYVKYRSIMLDLYIMLRTLVAMAKGAR